MAHVWILMIYTLALQKLTIGNRVKQLEGRIESVEIRQDVESMLRRKDSTYLSEKLEILETRFNDSEEKTLCCDAIQPKRSETPLTDQTESKYSAKEDFMKLMFAFKQEKIVNTRLRRRVPELENTVEGVGKELTNILNFVEEIRDAVTEEQDNLANNNRSKHTLSQKMDISIQMTAKAQETCKTVIKRLDGVEEVFERSFKTLSNKLEAMETIYRDLNETVGILSEITKPKSCFQIYNSGERRSGLHSIYLGDQLVPTKVFCDMQTDGGGWLVFQRRNDGVEDFYRSWHDYEQGFGEMDGEFWLGNSIISSLTDKCCHELRVDLEDFEGNTAYAKYDGFQVRPVSENYTLIVGEYSGTAGDALSYHADQQFSTKDRDNDKDAGNCAVIYHGAWWYKNCQYSHLNGQYYNTVKFYYKGLSWYQWKQNYYSMKKTEMILR